AMDPSTVQFRLKFAAAPFLGNVASSWCRVAAKHILEKYGDLNTPEAQIGTGPFRFKRYERGNLIEWEKNKDYFVRGLPYLDGVRQYILVGGPTQLADEDVLPYAVEVRSEEHTSELQSRSDLVCRLLLEKKKKKKIQH